MGAVVGGLRHKTAIIPLSDFKVRVCKRCGRIRPDSQSLCDCQTSQRESNQSPAPVCGPVSFAITAAIALAVFGLSRTLSTAGFGAIGVGGLMVMLAAAGIVVNVVAGLIGNSRGEPNSGRVAALGVAILVAVLGAGLLAR